MLRYVWSVTEESTVVVDDALKPASESFHVKYGEIICSKNVKTHVF